MAPKRKKQDLLEVEEALRSPERRDNVSDSHGVIEKIFVNDGTALDVSAMLDRALERRLSRDLLERLSGNPVTSQCKCNCKCQGSSDLSQAGTSGQGNVSSRPPPPHDLSGSESESEDSCSEQDSESDLEELIGSGACQTRDREESDSLIGIQKSRPFEDSSLHDLSSPGTSKDEAAISETPVAEVDPDLPFASKSKVNFNPGQLVVDWARSHFEDIPSPKELIKILEEQYVPDESNKDLFSPIKQSDFILKGMLHKANKDSDSNYFDRHKTEKHLYTSQHLLGLSYAPLMDALTNLSTVPDSGMARKLIGDGILAVASARHEISYARRELCRKIIRLDISPYLYSFKPTNTQLFGGESIEAQAKKAKEASKVNLDFVYKKPIASSTQNKNYQGFQKGKSQNQQKSGNRTRQGRGNAQRRRGKGKAQAQPKPSATPAESTT